MEFSMTAVANASAEKQEANNYPSIRFFSVGHRTSSPSPLRNLQTVWEPWQVARNTTINKVVVLQNSKEFRNMSLQNVRLTV